MVERFVDIEIVPEPLVVDKHSALCRTGCFVAPAKYYSKMTCYHTVGVQPSKQRRAHAESWARKCSGTCVYPKNSFSLCSPHIPRRAKSQYHHIEVIIDQKNKRRDGRSNSKPTLTRTHWHCDPINMCNRSSHFLKEPVCQWPYELCSSLRAPLPQHNASQHFHKDFNLRGREKKEAMHVAWRQLHPGHEKDTPRLSLFLPALAGPIPTTLKELLQPTRCLMASMSWCVITVVAYAS